MVLVKIIAFVVLNILHSLIFMESLCLEITAGVSKIRESGQPDLPFILVVLSESAISFTYLSLVLATEIFIK